jgi:hypothetical protein
MPVISHSSIKEIFKFCTNGLIYLAHRFPQSSLQYACTQLGYAASKQYRAAGYLLAASLPPQAEGPVNHELAHEGVAGEGDGDAVIMWLVCVTGIS